MEKRGKAITTLIFFFLTIQPDSGLKRSVATGPFVSYSKTSSISVHPESLALYGEPEQRQDLGGGQKPVPGPDNDKSWGQNIYQVQDDGNLSGVLVTLSAS